MQLMKLRKLKKLLCWMLLLLGSYQAAAQTTTDVLQQEVIFEANNENVIQLLEKIEKVTEAKFAYNPNDFNKKEKINFPKKKIKVGDLLGQIFEDTPIEFKAQGENVILFKTNVKKIGIRENVVIEKPRNIVFSGYVVDSETGEAMIAASVYEKKSFTATTTNNFGFFSLTLPPGAHTIVVSYVGFETQEINISKTQQMEIRLVPTSNEIEEVVVSASKDNEKEKDEVLSSRMGVLRISSAKLKAIPAMAGEPDILKAITLLPGIKQGVDGSAGFYVRGGGPDQNLILMDGVPMYNPYHLWGFLSTFNPDAINNIEITKGAFPARYGGRLSSVLDITLKDGNHQEWKKNLSFGILSARASVSGPLKKDVSTIFVSARRTVLDLLISPLAAERDKDEESSYKGQTGYYFGDINLKYTYKFSKKDRLYVSGFYSKDQAKIAVDANDGFLGETKLRETKGWGSSFVSARWNHLFNDKLFSNTTAYFSNYNYFSNTSTELNAIEDGNFPSSKNKSDYTSIINDFSIKQDYQYFLNHRHHIRFGGGAIFHNFKPGVNSFSQIVDGQTTISSTADKTIKASEFSLYAEDDFQLSDKLKINIGVHASALSVQDTSYTAIQPRFSARYLLNKKVALKIGYSKMTQYLHLLTSGSLTKSSDLWVPVTKEIAPPNSTQYSIGSAFSIGENYGVEIEGYYKDMKNLIDYKDGASFLITTDGWEEKVESGEGKSYGTEIFFQKKKGRLTGWAGYTLSWSTRQFDKINDGKQYPHKYDRRHDISLVGNYQLNKKWSLNGSWVFFSGNYVTLATTNHITPSYKGAANYSWWKFHGSGNIESNVLGYNPGINENASTRNNYQLPNYHRLDLSAALKKITKRGNEAEWIFGVTNAYNKFNPSFFVQNYKITGQGDDQRVESRLSQYTLFPILPSVSYNLSF